MRAELAVTAASARVGAGARQLWPTARAEALRCGTGTLWIVARTPTVPLAGAQLVLRGRHALLLRAAGRAAVDCP